MKKRSKYGRYAPLGRRTALRASAVTGAMWKSIFALATVLLTTFCWAGEVENRSVRIYLSDQYCESAEFLECVGFDVAVCSRLFVEASKGCDYSGVWSGIEGGDIKIAHERASKFSECVTQNLSKALPTREAEWNRCMRERSFAIRAERIQGRERPAGAAHNQQLKPPADAQAE